MSDEQGQVGQPEVRPSVLFHYIKTNFFRVILAQGAIGAVTPQKKVYFALYSERPAMPRQVTHEILDNGKLGEAIASEGKVGFIRDVGVGILMDRDDAANFRDWLSDRIAELDASSVEAKEK